MSITREKTSASDIDGASVKVGLVCIDDGASFRRLQAGSQYTAEAAYDGSPVVIASNAYHSIERFRKVAP